MASHTAAMMQRNTAQSRLNGKVLPDAAAPRYVQSLGAGRYDRFGKGEVFAMGASTCASQRLRTPAFAASSCARFDLHVAYLLTYQQCGVHSGRAHTAAQRPTHATCVPASHRNVIISWLPEPRQY